MGVSSRGSTISAAMGGCQAEIGVSSAMAAALCSYGWNTRASVNGCRNRHGTPLRTPVIGGGLVQIAVYRAQHYGRYKSHNAADSPRNRS
jgi:L-serine dehydratase